MNRWVVITLALMATVVVGRHLHRFGYFGAEQAGAPAVLDPLGVQVAQAEPLPPVESGTQETVLDGGALGVPGLAADAEDPAPEPDRAEVSSEPVPESRRQRVPLNPEPPLPERDRARASAKGPLTQLDPHQMLFEPGEKPPKSKPAVRKTRVQPARRDPAATKGPLTDVDPRQMLFEPGEPASRVESPVPAAEEPPAPPTPIPDAAPDASLEPGTDGQTKARIMKRLLRVMELAGEKP